MSLTDNMDTTAPMDMSGNSGSRGYRMTRQRKVILEELRSQDVHPSAEEIYEKV